MGSTKEQLLILLTTPFYILIIGGEILVSNYQKQASYTVKNTLQNIYLLLVNCGIDLLFRGIYIGVILTFFFSQRIYHWKTGWAYWICLLVFEDFMFYWLHRVDHFCRLFWATHVTHHSSEKYNLSVGFRSSVMEPLYRFIYFIPLAFCGFSPIDIAFMYSATQIWGILVHTEKIIKMGWLEYILVTPSHHRVHHASNPKYLDRNMGMFLILWDRVFGTFQPELSPLQYQQLTYGLTTPLQKESPANLIFHEWNQLFLDLRKPGLSLSEKLGYLLGPPGWSHDGSRLTSEQLREAEMAQDNPRPAHSIDL